MHSRRRHFVLLCVGAARWVNSSLLSANAGGYGTHRIVQAVSCLGSRRCSFVWIFTLGDGLVLCFGLRFTRPPCTFDWLSGMPCCHSTSPVRRLDDPLSFIIQLTVNVFPQGAASVLCAPAVASALRAIACRPGPSFRHQAIQAGTGWLRSSEDGGSLRQNCTAPTLVGLQECVGLGLCLVAHDQAVVSLMCVRRRREVLPLWQS